MKTYKQQHEEDTRIYRRWMMIGNIALFTEGAIIALALCLLIYGIMDMFNK